MQSVEMKKSLSSYTDCSIHLFFMFSQYAVRSLPQKENTILLKSAESQLRDLPNTGPVQPSFRTRALVLALSSVQQSARCYSQAYLTFLAGADPACRGVHRATGGTSAFQTRIQRIEDFATTAAGKGPSADDIRVGLLKLESNHGIGRVPSKQRIIVSAPHLPAVILNDPGATAPSARHPKSDSTAEMQSCARCIYNYVTQRVTMTAERLGFLSANRFETGATAD